MLTGTSLRRFCKNSETGATPSSASSGGDVPMLRCAQEGSRAASLGAKLALGVAGYQRGPLRPSSVDELQDQTRPWIWQWVCRASATYSLVSLFASSIISAGFFASAANIARQRFLIWLVGLKIDHGYFLGFARDGCVLVPQPFHVELCERPFDKACGFNVAIVLVECSLAW